MAFLSQYSIVAVLLLSYWFWLLFQKINYAQPTIDNGLINSIFAGNLKGRKDYVLDT